MVRDILSCGACGAPVGIDDAKCSYCKAGLVPVEAPSFTVSRVTGISRDGMRIEEMRDGESGYTVPWALGQGAKGINKKYTVHKKSGGTLNLLITMRRGTIFVNRDSFSLRDVGGWNSEDLIPVQVI